MVSTRYLLSRTGRALLTLFLVITFTFVMIRWLPGGPEDYLMSQLMMDPDITQEEINRRMEYYVNLRPDQPLWRQYIDYLTSILQGDLGTSIWFQTPINQIVAEAMPWTIYISAVAIFITAADGILFGALQAYKEGSRFDKGLTVSMILMSAVPYYIFAVIFLWIFAYQLGWFPSGGRYGEYVTYGFNPEFIGSILYHSALPIIVGVTLGFGGGALGMRANAIQVLGSDYLRVARIRGIPFGRLSLRYVARNAFLPVYTGLVVGTLGGLFGSSVITERLFSYTGMGWYFFEALSSRDYPLMMGGFLFIAIGTIVGYWLADLTYGLIDPRAGDPGEREGFTSLANNPITFFTNWARRVWKSIRRKIGSRDSGNRPMTNGRGAAVSAEFDDESLFNTTSEIQLTRRDRVYRVFEEKILIPWRVLRTDIRAVVGLSILSGFLLMGTVGVIVLDPPRAFDGAPLTPWFQSLDHPLGTNDRGMDLMKQTVHATPAMIKMMVGGAVFSTFMATLWGLFSGYAGGRVDAAMMAVADVIITVPGLPLVIILANWFQPESPYLIGLILAVDNWPGSARSLRSQVLTIRQESYVEASRAMHLSSLKILRNDIWPKMAPLIMLRMTGSAQGIISASVALYFLGILPFTSLNWGVMLNFAYSSGVWYNMQYIYWMAVPTLTLLFLSFGFVLLSQGFDRIFNPRIRARHKKGVEGDDEGPDITDDVNIESSSQF